MMKHNARAWGRASSGSSMGGMCVCVGGYSEDTGICMGVCLLYFVNTTFHHRIDRISTLSRN